MWQELQVLEDGLEIRSVDEDWHARLAHCYPQLGRHAQAAEQYRVVNSARPKDAMGYFKEGWSWRNAGNQEAAEAAFTLAARHDSELKAKRFGIGVFFEHGGFWTEARDAYEQLALSKPDDAALFFRLGTVTTV